MDRFHHHVDARAKAGSQEGHQPTAQATRRARPRHFAEIDAEVAVNDRGEVPKRFVQLGHVFRGGPLLWPVHR